MWDWINAHGGQSLIPAATSGDQLVGPQMPAAEDGNSIIASLSPSKKRRPTEMKHQKNPKGQVGDLA